MMSGGGGSECNGGIRESGGYLVCRCNMKQENAVACIFMYILTQHYAQTSSCKHIYLHMQC